MCATFGCLPSELAEEEADEVLQVWRVLNIYTDFRSKRA